MVLYTDPVTPRAGESVTVFYNPDATVLRGRPEVWLRGCWNRWGVLLEWVVCAAGASAPF